MPVAEVGERFEDLLALTPESIARYAEASHDWNPLHHDPRRAAESRFGTLIASGPHLASVFMGMTATHFAAKGLAPLGLEFSFQFRKAARAGDTVRLQWTVVRIDPKPRLDGVVVHMEGEVRSGGGELLVSGRSTLLVTARA